MLNFASIYVQACRFPNEMRKFCRQIQIFSMRMQRFSGEGKNVVSKVMRVNANVLYVTLWKHKTCEHKQSFLGERKKFGSECKCLWVNGREHKVVRIKFLLANAKFLGERRRLRENEKPLDSNVSSQPIFFSIIRAPWNPVTSLSQWIWTSMPVL